ncbi:MAG: hypothetical protein PHC51_13130 [bacterium]|nr:hypothetical protein [bacterium]
MNGEAAPVAHALPGCDALANDVLVPGCCLVASDAPDCVGLDDFFSFNNSSPRVECETDGLLGKTKPPFITIGKMEASS